MSPNPDHENFIYEFTTLPSTWAIRYDDCAYVEVDPRISGTRNRTVPLLLDQTNFRGYSPIVDAFLDDALGVGIASGVSLPMYDAVATKIHFDFSSVIPIIDGERREAIHRMMGDLMIFARYFHELILRVGVRKGMSPRNANMQSSQRDRDCLVLASRGHTIDSIGRQLEIDNGSVQTHFDSLRSKLAAPNQQDAIARAIRDDLIQI